MDGTGADSQAATTGVKVDGVSGFKQERGTDGPLWYLKHHLKIPNTI